MMRLSVLTVTSIMAFGTFAWAADASPVKKASNDAAVKVDAKVGAKAASTQPTEVKPAEAQQRTWQVIVSEVLQVFLVIFVPVLSTFLTSLLRRWKINVEYQQVASIATKAADWAEHKALAALKEGKEKTPGAEKMKLALDFANGLATQYKLSSKATEKLQGLIESALEKEPA